MPSAAFEIPEVRRRLDVINRLLTLPTSLLVRVHMGDQATIFHKNNKNDPNYGALLRSAFAPVRTYAKKLQIHFGMRSFALYAPQLQDSLANEHRQNVTAKFRRRWNQIVFAIINM